MIDSENILLNHIPGSLIGFNYALSSSNKETSVHFYVDDYQFERAWNELAKSVLSVSTIGVKQSAEAMQIWKASMDELIR